MLAESLSRPGAERRSTAGIGVVFVDCATDRPRALNNFRQLLQEVPEAISIVVVRRTGVETFTDSQLAGRARFVDARAKTRGEAQRLGCEAMTENCVLFTDSNSRVSSGWFRAASAAFDSGAGLIGGPVMQDNDRPRRLCDDAGFLLDYAVHSTAPYLNAEGHPSANNFGVARSLIELMAPGDLWKSALCRKAHQAGVVTSSTPAMVTTSTIHYRLRSVLSDQARRGRQHAALRRTEIGKPEVLIRILGAPLVPFVGTWRLARRAKVRSVLSPVRIAVFLGLCGWAAGEVLGYSDRTDAGRLGVFG